MKKNQKKLLLSFGLLLLSIIYTVLVKYIDVGTIGPKMSSVGFSSLNQWVRGTVGTNMFWYHVTKYLGIIPFLLVAFYGIVGLMQLVKRKSLWKVDKRLFFLGGLYVLLGIVYVFFEKIIINYRPVLMDGELEASYPSSHTMLAVVICLSSLLISKNYIKNKDFLKCFNIGTIILMVLLVFGRILSGVHWISDIIGGILISIMLVSFFYTAIEWKKC